jgi:hypothetical protein
MEEVYKNALLTISRAHPRRQASTIRYIMQRIFNAGYIHGRQIERLERK